MAKTLKFLREAVAVPINNIDAFIVDFDGCMTDNKVYVNQDGVEMVACSRSEGHAFEVLRHLKIPAFFLSTEVNPVVTERAKKLKVPVIQGSSDKVKDLKKLAKKEGYDLKKVLFVGNDLNDYHVMKLVGYSASPSDAHKRVKEISTFKLNRKGGEAVMRELLEEVFQLDFVKIGLY